MNIPHETQTLINDQEADGTCLQLCISGEWIILDRNIVFSALWGMVPPPSVT